MLKYPRARVQRNLAGNGMYGASLPEAVVVQDRPALVDAALLCLIWSEIHGNRGVLVRRGGGERTYYSRTPGASHRNEHAVHSAALATEETNESLSDVCDHTRSFADR